MSRRNNDSLYCPICGKKWNTHAKGGCDKKTLNRIDAQRKSDRNNSELNKPYWMRLKHGFEAMRLSDDSVDARCDED